MQTIKLPSIRLIHNRKNRATKTHPESLVIEVMHQRKRRYITIGVSLLVHQWNTNTQAVVQHKDADKLNKHIESVRRHLLDLLNEHCQRPSGFDLDTFISEVQIEHKAEALSFLEFMSQRIEQRGLKAGTLKQHYVALRAIEEYGRIVHFRDITPANILDFDAWLRGTKGMKYQPTIYGYHKRLKVYVNEAMRYGYISENPYTRVRIARGDESKIRYLKQTEVDAIRGAIIEDASLARVRALFILQVYTGLAYSDLYAVDWSEVDRREDGRYYIRQSRIKTGEEYFLVLLPPAVAVLESFGWALPKISNQKYNNYLKGLGIACGIKKPLTSHVARHTFATTIALSNKVPIEIVAKMMGHSDIKTTQKYAKVLAEDVIDAFKDLEAKL